MSVELIISAVSVSCKQPAFHHWSVSDGPVSDQQFHGRLTGKSGTLVFRESEPMISVGNLPHYLLR